MDPGPWYASYNRLAAAQAAAGDHHPLVAAAAAAAAAASGNSTSVTSSTAPATAVLPGGFLSPPAVGYETVFTPLFHGAVAASSAKQHYAAQVGQHRALAAQVAASKQAAESSEFHSQAQAQAFFEQGANAWQQNSPFGILPHESVVATSAGKTVQYENFNAHFAQSISNHISSQLAANSKAAASINRSQSPQVSSASVNKSNANAQVNASAFFQVPVTHPEGAAGKTFTSTNASNIQQQSCIVSSASSTKEYQRGQQTANRAFLSSPNQTSRTIEKNFASSPTVKQQQNPPQIQTKAQTKIYSELNNQREQQQQQRTNEETQQSQSSPISFSIMDAPGRINYSGSNASGKRASHFQHNYRQYQTQQQSQNANAEEFQRPKSGTEYQPNSNGSECNVAVPRRPSPLQAHSSASPLGHAQSPAYPMYHSPMNSMSSPQNSNNNNNNSQQVAPPSPLDVSVPRPNSQQTAGGSGNNNNVAYPSVITRTLNTDKSFTSERYDHSNAANQTNQACWDERQQQQRKFQQANQSNTQSSTYNNSSNNLDINSRQAAADNQRQQYFDSNSGHPVTLQDLSSCRGDPMTIVKNLQQQQTCPVQIAQVEIKQEIQKPPIKRRKSIDKPTTQIVPNSGEIHHHPPAGKRSRIPPPAHSTAGNQQQQQLQQQQQQPQNGGVYFEFERWNIPPPATKIFSTQAALHQQHQSLMVPHHPPPHGHPHGPTPLPYFAPFHIPNHPGEFNSNVELTPLTNYNDQQQQQQQQHSVVQQQHQHHQQHQQHQTQQQFASQPDDQPKVVVPNIEEELNFLSADTVARPAAINNYNAKPLLLVGGSNNKPIMDNKLSGPGAGFMSSYLKFLQGERDTSPPPVMRGGPSRKQSANTWTRRPTESDASANKLPNSSGDISNNGAIAGGTILPNLTGPPPGVTRLNTSGDPQDDPRYFPLPKERKKDSFDSSDDGFSSDDDFFGPNTRKHTRWLDSGRDRRTRGGRPNKSGGGPAERKRQRMMDRMGREKRKYKEKPITMKSEDVPKREPTKRAAKGKNSLTDLIKDADEPDEPPEYQDSEDSDPAWTPAAIVDDEDIVVPVKKKNRGRPGPKNKKQPRNLIAAAAHGAGINDLDGLGVYSSTTNNDTNNSSSKKLKIAHKNKQANVPTLEDNIVASMQNNFLATNDENPFKTGEFVAIKSELSKDWPAIWRVDGKTLLQKYEPFEQNGTTLYRMISTYAAWTEDKKQYVSVPVKYKTQSQLETIVEFLKDEIAIIDPKMQDECMKVSEKYQDNFEVYIQTLISQALDSNFLMEIFQEKDEYFLTNVQTIDEITSQKKDKLLLLVRWPANLQAAVCTWPCFNVLREIGPADAQDRTCAACNRNNVAVRVIMYGQPYNATTLEGCQPPAVSNAINEKDFFMCRICVSRVELASKVIHQKYLMYIECAKRVSEKRSSDPTKDTTCILNELLADENWLNQLFLEVRTFWSEIDCIEHSLKTKNLCAAV